MTETGFANVVGILSGMPAQTKWDDGVAMVYALVLRNHDDKRVLDAVAKLLHTEHFRPSVAMILESMGECHNIDRIKRFITRVHPSMEDTQEILWLRRGLLNEHDLQYVQAQGGWANVRKGAKPQRVVDTHGGKLLDGRNEGTTKYIAE
jgi:hypothetical protein